MSSNRVASFRIALEKGAFVAGLKGAERDVERSAKRMGGSLSRSIDEGLKKVSRGLKDLPGSGGGGAKSPFYSFFADLKALETRSMGTARRVGDGFRAAFSGVFGIGLRRSNMNMAPPGTGGGGGGGGGVSGFAIGAGAAIVGGVMSLAHKAIAKGTELTEKANKVEETALQISTTARESGGQYVDPKQLVAEFYSAAKAVKGVTADEAADAAGKFLTLTGDLNTARGSLITFAQVSKATGAKMGEIAESAASISQQFKITDAGQMREVFASLVYQGKNGAIEMKDLAGGMQKMAAAGASFGLTGVSGVKKIGGLVQIARTGTGSAEQAFTAVEDFFAMLKEHSKELGVNKVKVYEGKGVNKHTRDPQDIIIDAISKLGGNNLAKKNELMFKMFGMQGGRLMAPLVAKYQSAFSGAQGKGGAPATAAERKAAGIAALQAEFDRAVNVTGTWNDVLQDSARMQTANSAKMTAAWEELQGKIGQEILPHLTNFVDTLAKSPEIMTAFTKAIELTGVGLAKLLRLLGVAMPGDNVSERDYKKGLADDQRRMAEQKIADSAENKAALQKWQDSNRTKQKARELGAGDVGLGGAAMLSQAQDAITDKLDPLAAIAKRDKGKKGKSALGGALEVQTFDMPTAQEPATAAERFAKRFGGGAGVPGASGGTGAPAAPLAVPPGGLPVSLNASQVIRVEIVGDRTATPGGARSPMPGPAPR